MNARFLAFCWAELSGKLSGRVDPYPAGGATLRRVEAPAGGGGTLTRSRSIRFSSTSTCEPRSLDQRRDAGQHVGHQLGRDGFDELGTARLQVHRAHLVAQHDAIGHQPGAG